MKQWFFGKDDPNRISLENVFPVGDIVFSTPFGVETGRHRRIFAEGESKLLQSFGDHADHLLAERPTPLGKWVAIDRYFSSGIQMVYEPATTAMEACGLLVFALRLDLINLCHLRLSPVAMITGRVGYKDFFKKSVPLPDGIKNGFLDVAPLIVKPSRCLN